MTVTPTPCESGAAKCCLMNALFDYGETFFLNIRSSMNGTLIWIAIISIGRCKPMWDTNWEWPWPTRRHGWLDHSSTRHWNRPGAETSWRNGMAPSSSRGLLTQGNNMTVKCIVPKGGCNFCEKYKFQHMKINRQMPEQDKTEKRKKICPCPFTVHFWKHKRNCYHVTIRKGNSLLCVLGRDLTQ